MASGDKNLGQYFLIQSKTNSSLVLEVKDGSRSSGAHVVVGECQMQVKVHKDHQLWYFDSFSETLCNKLDGFRMHCNEKNEVVVMPSGEYDNEQKWYIADEFIRLKSQPSLSIGFDGDGRDGRPCSALPTSENNRWMIHRQPPFYLYINSVSSPELVVDVRHADHKPGAKVILYANKSDLADNQLWYEDENGVLRSKLNSFALDSSGKEVVLRPYDSKNANHQWVICGDSMRNVSQPHLRISIKMKCFLSSPALIVANNSSASATVPYAEHHCWQFNYISHQESLHHSGCGKFFNICCRVGGYALQVEGRLIEPGSIVAREVRDINLVRQQFYQDEVSGTVRSVFRNYCLDLDNKELLVVNPYIPYKKTQQWTVVGKTIRSQYSSDTVLQICDSPDAPGSRVTQGDYTGGNHQLWDILYVPARCFVITSRMNGKVLDVKGDESSAGAALIVYERKAQVSANQLWYEDECGLLRSKLNGYVIDTRNGEAAVRPFDPTIKQQQWIISGDRVQNRFDPSQVLDIYGNSSLSSKVGSYTFRGSHNQRWSFELV